MIRILLDDVVVFFGVRILLKSASAHSPKNSAEGQKFVKAEVKALFVSRIFMASFLVPGQANIAREIHSGFAHGTSSLFVTIVY